MPNIPVNPVIPQEKRRRISKKLIKALYDIYGNLILDEEVFDYYYKIDPKSAANVQVSRDEINNVYKYASKNLYENAKKSKADIKTMYDLINKKQLTEDEEQQLSDLYESTMDNLESASTQAMYNALFNGVKLNDYKAMKDEPMKALYKAANAFETAKNTVEIIEVERQATKGLKKIEAIEKQVEEYNNSKALFLSAHPDFDYQRYTEELAELNEQIKKAEGERDISLKTVENMIAEDLKALADKTAQINGLVVTQKAKLTALLAVEKMEKQKGKLNEEIQKATTTITFYKNLKTKESEIQESYKKELNVIKADETVAKKLSAEEEVQKKAEILARYNHMAEQITKALANGNVYETFKDEVDAFLKEIEYDTAENKEAGIPNDSLKTKLERDLDYVQKKADEIVVPEETANKMKQLEKDIAEYEGNFKRYDVEIQSWQQVEAKKKEEWNKLDEYSRMKCTKYSIHTGNYEAQREAVNEAVKILTQDREEKRVQAEQKKNELIETKEKYNKRLYESFDNNTKALVDRKNQLNEVIGKAKTVYGEYRKINLAYKENIKDKHEKLNNKITRCISEDISRLYFDEVKIAKHKNSPEYQNMMHQLNLFNGNLSAEQRNIVLADIKANAQIYIDAKNDQNRLFRSAAGQARISFAEAIVKFVDDTQKDIERVKAKTNKMEAKIKALADNGYTIIKKEDKYLNSLIGAEAEKVRRDDAEARKQQASAQKKEVKEPAIEKKPPVKEKEELVKEK